MSTVKTLLCLFKDDTKKEFCLRNRNTDYLFGTKELKQCYDIINSDDICIAEEVVRLNKFFANNNFSVITVLDAKNSYNRDQKQINLFKNQYIDEYKLKGYTWNENLDEFKIEYNDNSENREIIKAIKNFRNLATLYKEKTIDLQESYKLKEIEYDEKISDLEDLYNNKLAEYEKLSKELDTQYDKKKSILETELSKINTKWNSLNIECTKITDRISNGNDKINELLKRYKNIETDCNNLTFKKEKLESYIADYKKSNEYLSNEFDKQTSKLNELNCKIKDAEKELIHIEDRKQSIINEISQYISKTISPNELYDKLNSLVRMIKTNSKFYNNRCPKYEIEHLIKIGLNESIIIEKLNENNINISTN